jgi:hypothetical protein
MPDRAADVTRIVQGGRERGLSEDQIRSLVARYDERLAQAGTPPAAATAGMTPQSTVEGDPEPPGFTSIDALTAEGGPLDAPIYRNMVGSARYGAVGTPLIPGSTRAVVDTGKAAAHKVASVAGKALPFTVRAGMRMAGAPAPVADVVSDAVAAYQKGAKAIPSAPPAASPPVTQGPPAAPVARTPAPGSSGAPQLSPQQLRNEVGLAARRQNLKLSDQELEIADGMVRQGVSPADAVKTVAQVAKPAPTPPAAKPKLSAAETKEYVRLRSAGKTNQEAMEALRQQREFVAQFGTPSTADVRSRVAERNATGRWPQ